MKWRTTCRKGHPWTEDNTFIDSRGYRQCRTCRSTCHRGHPWDEENTYTEANGHRRCRACKRLDSAKYRSAIFHQVDVRPDDVDLDNPDYRLVLDCGPDVRQVRIYADDEDQATYKATRLAAAHPDALGGVLVDRDDRPVARFNKREGRAA